MKRWSLLGKRYPYETFDDDNTYDERPDLSNSGGVFCSIGFHGQQFIKCVKHKPYETLK